MGQPFFQALTHVLVGVHHDDFFVLRVQCVASCKPVSPTMAGRRGFDYRLPSAAGISIERQNAYQNGEAQVEFEMQHRCGTALTLII